MIDFDSLRCGDWEAIYELLDGEGHLSQDGQIELVRLKKGVFK